MQGNSWKIVPHLQGEQATPHQITLHRLALEDSLHLRCRTGCCHLQSLFSTARDHLVFTNRF